MCIIFVYIRVYLGHYTNLYVHIVVSRHQIAFVLHPPLQLDNDRLSCQSVQKRLGVQRHSLHWVDRCQKYRNTQNTAYSHIATVCRVQQISENKKRKKKKAELDDLTMCYSNWVAPHPREGLRMWALVYCFLPWWLSEKHCAGHLEEIILQSATHRAILSAVKTSREAIVAAKELKKLILLVNLYNFVGVTSRAWSQRWAIGLVYCLLF